MSWVSAGRIGLTKPIPMKAIIAAKARAQTAFGWSKIVLPLSVPLAVIGHSLLSGSGFG